MEALSPLASIVTGLFPRHLCEPAPGQRVSLYVRPPLSPGDVNQAVLLSLRVFLCEAARFWPWPWLAYQVSR